MNNTVNTLQDFISTNGITMDVRRCRTSRSPFMSDPGMSHWGCVITAPSGYLTVTFSQGSAHVGEPSLESVLDCLASDAASVENARDFDDWCAELGFDTDSRKAYACWELTRQQTTDLENALGDALYRELLWDIERA